MGCFNLPKDLKDPDYQGQLNKFYRFFGLGGGAYRCLVSPYIKPLSLGLLRLLFGLYMLASFLTHFFHLIMDQQTFIQKQGWKLLGDLMMHCFFGEAFYFLISAYHTITFAVRSRNRKITDRERKVLTLWPRPLQVTHLFLQTTVLTFPLFCTIVYLYWTLPAQPTWHTQSWSRWSTITFYILNTVLSYIELFLSASRPRPWSHLIIILLVLGLYLAFHSGLVAASHGKLWIYTAFKFSLKMNRGWISAVRILGLCLLATGSFCVMQLLLWIKCRYLGGLKTPSVRHHGESISLDTLPGHPHYHGRV